MRFLERPRTAARRSLGALALIALVASAGASAAGDEEEPALHIEPGQWRFKSVSKMPMSAHPQSRTTTECVTDGRRSADQLAKNSSSGCEFSDVVVSADTMKWRMACGNGSERITGEAEFQSTGTAVEGVIHMRMEHGGMKLAIEHTLSGTRTGDCDPPTPAP